MERAIDATTTIHATAVHARELLEADPVAVFAADATAHERRTRAFRLPLTVDIGGGSSVSHDVDVTLGVPEPIGNGGVRVELAWHAAQHERLFPTFEGALEIFEDDDEGEDAGETALRIAGRYTIPLGAVGRFGDGLAGRRIARRAVHHLVQHLARRIDAEVDTRLEALGFHSERSDYTIVLSDGDHPELYVG